MTVLLNKAGRVGIKPRLLALVCLAASGLSPFVVAQESGTSGSQPTLSSSSGEVNKAGFSLKPTGLSTGEWPTLRLDFSIERGDRTSFRNLKLADVEPKVDGQSTRVNDGDLVLKTNEAASILLLLDGSGSMASSGGVAKLAAAKEAMKTLIDNLVSGDKICLVVFDEEARTILPVTADKELAKREIENFTIRKENSRYTRLYDAVKYALVEAQKSGIKNILLISDGWEDTPDTRNLLGKPTELAAYKEEQEQFITQESRRTDTRIFTVAIGDEKGKGLNYVDRTALGNISKGANGGLGVYIEITATTGNQALKQDFLLNRLQQTLEELRKFFRYGYSLTIHASDTAQRDAQEHKLWVGFTVGENPRVQLPVEYTYAWATASGPPVVKAVKFPSPIFIQSAPRSVRWQQLFVIYLALLSVLAILGFVPALGRKLAGGGQALKLHKSVVVVGARSPLIGSVCPNEGRGSGGQYLIKADDVVLVCPDPRCQTPHHLSCWRFNDHHCMKRICNYELVVPANVLEKFGLMERNAG
jgi:Mg-chelatase subunit ChlD